MPIEYRRVSPAGPARARLDQRQWIWRPNLAPVAAIWLIIATLLMGVYINPPHAIIVDLPAPYPDDDLGPLTPVSDRLVIDPDGAIFWNAHPITDRQLTDILSASDQRPYGSALLFTPDADAPYARVIHVLGMVRQAGLIDHCFHFAQIARYRQYDRPGTFDELTPYHREDCRTYY